MDIPTTQLLCLEQDDYSIKDHISKFIKLLNLTNFLCRFYLVSHSERSCSSKSILALCPFASMAPCSLVSMARHATNSTEHACPSGTTLFSYSHAFTSGIHSACCASYLYTSSFSPYSRLFLLWAPSFNNTSLVHYVASWSLFCQLKLSGGVNFGFKTHLSYHWSVVIMQLVSVFWNSTFFILAHYTEQCDKLNTNGLTHLHDCLAGHVLFSLKYFRQAFISVFMKWANTESTLLVLLYFTLSLNINNCYCHIYCI